MVKLAGPAMSLDASGTLAGTITFSKWKGRPYARARVIPSNPKSGGQVGMRGMFAFLSQQWASLTAGNQATWEDRASAAAISTFNAFLSYNQFRARNFKAPTQEFPEVETAFSGTMGAFTVAAGVRSIVCTQAITVAGNGWGVAFFRSPTGTFTTAYDNLKKVVPFDGTNDVIFVDSPLDPGAYYYDTRPLTDDGAMGAETGEETDTVV